MAKNTALLKRLQKDGATDTPTPPKPSPVAKSGPPSSFADTTVEEHKEDLKNFVAADTLTPPAGAPPPDSKLDTTPPAALPVTDPHAVWSALIRTPQGQRLTDPRIQSLSPQRFDTVFLAALKSAFLAGWDARSGGGVK